MVNDTAGPWTRHLSARVHADRETVFRLLSEMELWPAIFPHVRSARVIRRSGQHRLVRVRATWHDIPIGWTTIETAEPEHGRITLRHLSRLTRGSVAVWTVSPTRTVDGAPVVDVTAEQQVAVQVPLIGGLIAHQFVGGRVGRDLGQKILDRVKDIAEGGSLAGRQ